MKSQDMFGLPKGLSTAPKGAQVFFQVINVFGGLLFVVWLGAKAHQIGIL